MNGKVFTSTTPRKPKNLKFFFEKSSKFEFWLVRKNWNHLSFVNISPTLVINASMERSSRELHHGNSKVLFFPKKKSKFEFWHVTKSWNHLSFVNISPTLVIDTSMERSSRVLQHGNQKIKFFFSKKFEIEFDLYFDLCWRAEIIQVGLNMHLYVDIGDASSSLWGSTSSFLVAWVAIFQNCSGYAIFGSFLLIPW